MKLQEISISDQKKLCLDGLSEFDEFCKKNGLRYWLAYGTLIGAIRHKGYIPWDDDIDLWMPRNDYERMIKMQGGKKIGTGWRLYSYKRCKDYLFPWTKLCLDHTAVLPSRFNNGFVYGCSIDIFPLDEFRSGSIEEAEELLRSINNKYKKHIRMIRPYTGGLNGVRHKWKKMIKKLYYNCSKCILGSVRKFINQYDDIRLINDDSKSKLFVSTSPCASYPWVWNKDNFENTVYVEFESLQLPVPCGYDEILTRVYGEYMKLPPVEKRKTEHSYIAYYK